MYAIISDFAIANALLICMFTCLQRDHQISSSDIVNQVYFP